MTSNIGSDILLKKAEQKRERLSKEELLNLLDPLLKATFRPEFLNRLDEVLPFLPLTEKDIEKIVELQLGKVAQRLEEHHVALKWDSKVTQHLAREGYDPAFGARPLKRLIQQEVVNLFATAILEGKIPSHAELLLTGETVDGDFKIEYTVEKANKRSSK